ncbi:MAG: hypothetical protein II681_05600 [Bacteroidaceae bacterium]|nr:hypothetical protein [Bacteroidaceae bacterium]
MKQNYVWREPKLRVVIVVATRGFYSVDNELFTRRTWSAMQWCADESKSMDRDEKSNARQCVILHPKKLHSASRAKKMASRPQ